MTREEALEVAGEAVLRLVREPLGNHVYDIREREMKGWDGPRVANWSEGARLAEIAAKALGWDGTYLFQENGENNG